MLKESSLAWLAAVPELDAEPTPFLAIDLAAMERNLRRMAERPVRLRPHVKHHKSSELARLQVEAGGVGVTCATTEEVDAVARAGITDVLLANVVVQPQRAAALAEAATAARVTVAVDSPAGVAALDTAARRVGTTIGVVIDLDVGLHRTGVSSVDAGVALAERVGAAGGLELRGVMAYEGHLVAIADAEERTRAVLGALVPAVQLCDRLGIELLTGGSTPTYAAFASLPLVTEVQAGSYLLMDATYAALGLEFEPALAAVTTVLSSRPAGDVTVDAGSKRLAADLGPPAIAGIEALHTGVSEEHNQFRVVDGSVPAVGDRLALIPGHTCTTMSLHRAVYGCRDGRLERTIEIDARDRLA